MLCHFWSCDHLINERVWLLNFEVSVGVVSVFIDSSIMF